MRSRLSICQMQAHQQCWAWKPVSSGNRRLERSAGEENGHTEHPSMGNEGTKGWDIVQGIWWSLAWEKKAHEILFSFRDVFLKSEMKIALHIFFPTPWYCIRGHTARNDHLHSQGSMAPPR